MIFSAFLWILVIWYTFANFIFCIFPVITFNLLLTFLSPSNLASFLFLKVHMLLLLSCFSHVRLCATPEMAAHQAPPSLGFSRQEHEWVAIAFSNAWKWKVKVKSLSRIRLLVTPWTAAYQAPPSMGFSRQVYWSGLPSPSLNAEDEGSKTDQETRILHAPGCSQFFFFNENKHNIVNQLYFN